MHDSDRDLTETEALALHDGGFDLSCEELGDDDPLAQTASEYVALVGSALTITAAATRLNVEPNQIRQQLTGYPPKLYGIHLDSDWYIPELQFEENSLLPGLAEVVAALNPRLHPISFCRWLTTPNTDLEDRLGRAHSPRDWLRLGYRPSLVVTLAADL